MFNLFLKEYVDKKVTIQYPKLNKDLYLLSLTIEDVIEYERRIYNTLVGGSNILIKLLNNADIGLLDSVEDVRDKIEKTNYKFLARYSDIVSDIEKGNIHKSVIIPKANEIFIYSEFNNISNINDINYKDIESIKCIYSNKNNLAIFHPTRYENITNNDLFIYAIDIPAMILQFKYWVNEQLKLDNDINIRRFLYTIPYTNIIHSLVNINIGNIYKALIIGGVIEPYYNPEPISIRDNYHAILTDIEKQYNELSHKPSSRYEDILNNMVTYDGTMLKALKLDLDKYPTRQSEWVYWLSRIEYMNMLLLYGNDRTRYINKDYITDLAIDIKLATRNRIWDNMPDGTIKNKFMHELQLVKELIDYKG